MRMHVLVGRGRRTDAAAGTVAPAVAALVALVMPACSGESAPADVAELVPAAPAALAEASPDVAPLTIRLLEVTRVGEGAMDVRFSVACPADASAPVPIAELFASAPADAGAIADVFALDETAAKRYFVVRDADRRPVGSRDLDPVAPGTSRVLWTRLAAPPPGVAVVTIQMPHTPPFAAVPITDSGAGGPPAGEPLPPAGRM